ncbi:hypothetical protein [Halorussus amylolyticus]|uniref:hypothetical protein n=1 Tax=Halorussus amylolyticus TaxID=1126242 RepID=UPI00104AD888|nr:hypothetical protein [Halorussus amylolyticus]
MTDPPDDLTPRLDTANRLERVIDAQSATLDRIDTKSERIARLLALLLGVVLSSLSLGTQLAGVAFESLSLPTRLAFLLGIGFLLLALAASILTLLSSRFRIGLTAATGDLLSRPELDPQLESHLRRVVGTYANSVEQNRKIIEANAGWFKRSLVLFLLGESYLVISVGLFFSGLNSQPGWVILTMSVPIVVWLAKYVLSGRYLTLTLELRTND